ncbi:helix-turn-helix domain-containing protein [Escherichia coli]|nr:helix-turn-helix domain-containing protein [Escherichia coli]
MKALDKAICIVGGATRLAEKLNVSPMTVSHWRHRDNGFVPANRVIPIFNATGVTPHELPPNSW